jgi:hypothetical protein
MEKWPWIWFRRLRPAQAPCDDNPASQDLGTGTDGDIPGCVGRQPKGPGELLPPNAPPPPPEPQPHEEAPPDQPPQTPMSPKGRRILGTRVSEVAGFRSFGIRRRAGHAAA